MILTEIHLISSGCSHTNIALQDQNLRLKHTMHSSVLSVLFPYNKAKSTPAMLEIYVSIAFLKISCVTKYYKHEINIFFKDDTKLFFTDVGDL